MIDFPFDEAGHGPRDDLSTLQRFRQTHSDGAKTICWVPSFFSHDAQKDLGMLVILEHCSPGSGSASTRTICRRRTARRRSRSWKISGACCGSECRAIWMRPMDSRP